MTTHIIDITDNFIDGAVQADPFACPLAKGIHAALHADVSVTTRIRVTYADETGACYVMLPELLEWRRTFDRGGDVRPIRIRLEGDGVLGTADIEVQY